MYKDHIKFIVAYRDIIAHINKRRKLIRFRPLAKRRKLIRFRPLSTKMPKNTRWSEYFNIYY